MPAIGRDSGTPASIIESEAPQTVAMEEEPFELGDLRDDADGVGEGFLRRQQRMHRPPGELAMADLAPAGRAHAARLVGRIGREVVVQHEGLAGFALQRVDDLLILAGAQRGDHERLGLAPGEEGRAMGPRQHADLAFDRTHGLGVAPVDAPAGLQDRAAHDLLLQRLELLADQLGRQALGDEGLGRLRLHGGDLLGARLLGGLGIGGAQIALGDLGQTLGHGLGLRRCHRQIPGLLGAELGQLDDGLDHRLELLEAEGDGAQHDLLGELLGLRFHHQHAFAGAGDHEVEGGVRQVLLQRVQDIFALGIADAGGGDGAEEGDARDGQRRRGADQGDDIRIVLQVVAQHRADDLGLVAEAGREERADRAVDEAGGQHLLLGRPAFALEKAAGDLAGGEGLFLVVDGEREEVDPRLRLFLGHGGAEHDGLAIGGEHGAVGLAGDAARSRGRACARPS